MNEQELKKALIERKFKEGNEKQNILNYLNE